MYQVQIHCSEVQGHSKLTILFPNSQTGISLEPAEQIEKYVFISTHLNVFFILNSNMVITILIFKTFGKRFEKMTCLFTSEVSCHNPPLPGLLDHALPVLNHDQTDHNTKPMEHWCIATVSVIQLLLYDIITSLANQQWTYMSTVDSPVNQQ